MGGEKENKNELIRVFVCIEFPDEIVKEIASVTIERYLKFIIIYY